MTTKASARPQLPIPSQNVASAVQEVPCFSARGYSDSVIPSRRTTMMNEQKMYDPNAMSTIGLVASPIATANMPLLPRFVKSRQNLRLPSFKSLGISSRIPDALLTPPDETTILDWSHPPPTSSIISRTSSLTSGVVPKTPSPDRTDISSVLGNMNTASEAPASTQLTMATTEAHADENEDGVAPMSSDSEGSNHDYSNDWLIGTTQALRKLFLPEGRPSSLTSLVTNVNFNVMHNVVLMLSHTQPCPLSTTANDEGAIGEAAKSGSESVNQAPPPPPQKTAFQVILDVVQQQVEARGLYIDVSHAVPSKFSLTQIPNSPATTPNIRASGADYFSLNVFPKAVVAMDHLDALNTSVPSSPHPVVAPCSINVSILERYIPPSSAEEYLQLFSTDAPSVLVDRLYELSRHGGTLIFIYPTREGASTFASDYLSPLLDPLLRNMIGVYQLSADIGTSIGGMSAADHMLSFDNMTRKINALLRKLSRGVSAISRPTPRYTLVYSSIEDVAPKREVWTQWWSHQESPRIRRVMERYYERGKSLPEHPNKNTTVTARGLEREVLDGVMKKRTYADSAEREGIELGIFVIKRTA